jgi:tight adherence protein B
MTIGVLVLLAFIAVTAGVVGMFMLMSGRSQVQREKAIHNRLQEVGGAAGPTEEGGAAAASGGTLLLKEIVGPMPNMDRMATAALKGSSVERWLQQTGTAMTISAVILITLMFGILAAIATFMFTHLWWAAMVAFVIGLGVQPLLLKRKRAGRIDKFEEHFPEALDLLSRAVRAGHAFSAGMKMVADELEDPVGPEFRKAFDEQNYGLPLKESLNALADRIPLLDVKFFATAVLIQRETGGNLAEILDNLAGVVRERFKIRRQVRVHTAHGRFTGYVLMALPAFLAVALMFINPEHMNLLFEERIGQMMIVACIVMQAIGFIWIKQIVKIEV